MKITTDPEVVTKIIIPECALAFYLYLPIRLAGSPKIVIPPALEDYRALVDCALEREGEAGDGKFVYLTVKRLYVEPRCVGGRPGWHTDGFGTSDINYIWTDADPTEFCVQDFDLTDDHEISMAEMEEQAAPENIIQFEPTDLIRITPSDVHRCPSKVTPGYRTFARVSISDARYDMIGNAHNYGLDYKWIMHPRQVERNDTQAA